MSASPSSNLTEPVAETLVPGGVGSLLGASQYVSPSYWLSWVTEQICGTNPTEWIAEQYAGNWEDASKAGGAIANLAEFNTDWSLELKKAQEDLQHEWQGNAADAAGKYFTDLRQAVDSQVGAMKDLSHQFQVMAQGVSSTTNAIKSAYEALMDTIIAAAVSAAAAAGTSWTVVGGVIGGSATAAAIANGIRLWAKILDLMGQAWAIAESFSGVVMGFLGGVKGLDMHPLPGGGYNHPGVD